MREESGPTKRQYVTQRELMEFREEMKRLLRMVLDVFVELVVKPKGATAKRLNRMAADLHSHTIKEAALFRRHNGASALKGDSSGTP